MNRIKLASSTALGIVIGGIAFNAMPSSAQLATIDVSSIAQTIQSNSFLSGIQSIMSTVSSTMNEVKAYANSIFGALGDNTFGTVQQLLQQGFTQEANYAKAQVGAQQQITDASNMAMARFSRDMRNAQIRDEQTASPSACAAVDGGVSTMSAGVQAYDVAQAIASVHDLRGEAGPGMPSYYGAGQGMASMAANHISYYCNATDVAAGLCSTPSSRPDADQQYGSLFGPGTYADQTAIVAAKDFAINLIEPVAPAALRGDQLTSTQGQEAAVRRRSFNARMSLAQTVVDQAIGMQSPSVPLTQVQQTYLTNMGLPAQTNGSWFQVLQIEAERRISDVSWHSTLQNMPPAAVKREVALELALSNYLAFQQLKLQIQHTMISAAQLAQSTERDFTPTVRMPTPSMTSN